MQKTVLSIAMATVLLVGVAAIAFLAAGPDAPAEPGITFETGDAEFGAPFELTDQHGERVRSAELFERPALVYFGYTYCPDVCPIDTQIISDAVAILDERGIEVTPVFITVDPERDDAEALSYFTEPMHPRFVGLTGSPDEIRALADAYKVYFSRVDMPDSAAGYLVNHTAYTYLVAPGGAGGDVRAVFRNGVAPEAIAEETARRLAGST